DTGIDRIIESDRQQIVITMVAAPKRQIENIHSVSDGSINCVQDVFTASVQHVAGENIVIAQECPRRHAGHTIDQNTVYHCVQRGIKNSGCDPGSMRSVVLNGLRIEVRLAVLIIENLGYNNFRGDVIAVLVWVLRIAVCRIALRKAGRIAETSRIEERMSVVDTGINVADLDAGSGSGSSTSTGPRGVGIHDEMALAQVRMIKSIVLGALDHRCGGDCR